MKTVPPSTTPCTTFSEAARLLNILDDHDVWLRTLEEGSSFLTPHQMRDLLVQIIVFGHPQGANRLWESQTAYGHIDRNDYYGGLLHILFNAENVGEKGFLPYAIRIALSLLKATF
jgi:hypothetical protein